MSLSSQLVASSIAKPLPPIPGTLGVEILPTLIDPLSAVFHYVVPITVAADVAANVAVETITRVDIPTLVSNEWFRINKNSITLTAMTVNIIPAQNRHICCAMSFVPTKATTPTNFDAVASSRSTMLAFTQLVPTGGASPRISFEVVSWLEPGIATTWTPYDPMQMGPSLVVSTRHNHASAVAAGTLIGSLHVQYGLSSK